MKIALGKVVQGNVILEGDGLDEGSAVAVLVREPADEGFEVAAEEKAELLAAIAEADLGKLTDAEEVLKRLQ